MTTAVVMIFHTEVQTMDMVVDMEDQEDLEMNPDITMNPHENITEW